jgi:carbon-monoxide dehydrogenase iron sulfur subunit
MFSKRVKPMFKTLLVEPDKCTTCRLCELACAERHEGTYRPSRAHVQVTIHTDDAFYFPRVCLQCDDAPCIEACPNDALVRDPETNAVLVVAEKCNACGDCEPACPYGAIRLWDELAHKCDLCGGDPECVRFCATGALRYESQESWPQAERQAYADRLEELAQEVNA